MRGEGRSSRTPREEVGGGQGPGVEHVCVLGSPGKGLLDHLKAGGSAGDAT